MPSIQEPRCPHCEKPYSGTFPGGDDVEITCPACGQTTASPNWFTYEPAPDSIEDMPD